QQSQTADDRVGETVVEETVTLGDRFQFACIAAFDANVGEARAQMLVQRLVQFEYEQVARRDAMAEHRTREYARAAAELDDALGAVWQFSDHLPRELPSRRRQRSDAERVFQPLAKKGPRFGHIRAGALVFGPIRRSHAKIHGKGRLSYRHASPLTTKTNP